MTNDELLEKLEETIKIQSLKTIESLKEVYYHEFSKLNDILIGIENRLSNEIKGIKSDIRSMKSDIEDIKIKVTRLESRVTGQESLKDSIESLQERVLILERWFRDDTVAKAWPYKSKFNKEDWEHMKEKD